MNTEIIGLDLICNRTYGKNLNIKKNDSDNVLQNDETKQDIYDLIQTRLDDSTVPNTKNKILYNLVDSLIHAINLILEDN